MCFKQIELYLMEVIYWVIYLYWGSNYNYKQSVNVLGDYASCISLFF